MTRSEYRPALNGGCYSAAPLSEFTAPSICMAYKTVTGEDEYEDSLATVTAFGRTVTGYTRGRPTTPAFMSAATRWLDYEETPIVRLISQTEGRITVITTTTSWEEQRTAMYYQNMLLLAARAADETSSTETSGAEETAAEETSEGPEESGDGHEGSGAARLGGQGNIGMVVAAWIAAMVLGGAALVQM